MRIAMHTLAFAIIAGAACGSDVESPLDPTEAEFAAELGIDLAAMTRTPSGLYYQDVEVGTGDGAVAEDFVSVLYRAWLPNGTLVDEVQDREIPFRFQLGVGFVIPGWEEGLMGMRAGGVRKLVVPPHLAYADQRVGPIPPNSILVFEVELIEIG